jgi:hypothetical protein
VQRFLQKHASAVTGSLKGFDCPRVGQTAHPRRHSRSPQRRARLDRDCDGSHACASELFRAFCSSLRMVPTWDWIISISVPTVPGSEGKPARNHANPLAVDRGNQLGEHGLNLFRIHLLLERHELSRLLIAPDA